MSAQEITVIPALAGFQLVALTSWQINQMNNLVSRSSLPSTPIGGGHDDLHALAQLKFKPLLASLGINATTRSMILAQVVARMAVPASERATSSLSDFGRR